MAESHPISLPFKATVTMPLFSLGLIFIILADLLHNFHIVSDYNLTKLGGILLAFLGGIYVLKKGQMRTFPGIIPLLGLASLPPLVHGYVSLGLLFHVILVVAIVSIQGIHLRWIARGGSFFLGVILFLVVIGLCLTGDFLFLRHQNFPFDFYHATPLSNPNIAARSIVIVLPFLFFSRLQGILNNKTWAVFLIGSVLTIVIIAMSRANTVALFVMALYWLLFTQKNIFSKRTLFYSVLLAFICSVAIFFGPLQHAYKRTIAIFENSYQLILSAEGGHLNYEHAPARARTWAASIIVFLENPIFGVGQSSKQQLAQVGSAEEDETIAVHGALLNALVSYGLIGFLLLLSALLQIYLRLGKVGRMFILATLVSQIGADIYVHTIFWIFLGIFLLFDPKQLSSYQFCYHSNVIRDKRAIV